MIFTILTALLATLGLAGIVLVVGGGLNRVGRVPDRIESLGPFELVTHAGRDESYSVRYRGRPFSFTGRAGMSGEGTASYETVHALITFDRQPPAFVVQVGDPNNTGFFYLIHEVEGGPRAEYLGESHAGISADWLEAPDLGRGTREIAVHRARMGGGRFLLLGDTCVLDTKTLAVYTFTSPAGCFYSPFKGPLGLSPDDRSFVRLASTSGDDVVLVVVRFTDALSYSLPIDRRTMRYTEIEDLDAAWVDHHFEWRRGEDGSDRLVRRSQFVPLPYRGKLSVDAADRYREYRLPPSAPALYDSLVAFVGREFGAVTERDNAGDRSVTLRIGDALVNVIYAADRVTVFSERGKDSRPVLKIARRFDQELATSRFDGLLEQPSQEGAGP